ncbi:NAD(P)-binding protein [Neolentinus lepideus HHB14362 ss-1]|uniref:NAD(P)-binding protein n=1 Tax=Neolentinus lepideus HHB14362 ss-1 TaxID=1314782 RepID=A0A165MDS4_9AGAM|nr:NAD(P)-binding protein [Neolentinus lepideus HHB14362 ss-1]
MAAQTRVALVTGAAGDLGHGIALRLARDGLDVAVNDLPARAADLDKVVAEIKALGRQSIPVPGDVSVEADVEGMVEKTVAALGGLDVMVANVGIFFAKFVVDMDVEQWDRLFAINIRGVMLCHKHAGKQMIKQGRGGRLLAACSVAGLTGAPLCGAYAASKFAVRGFIQAAASEFGKFGVTVNAYAPGFIGNTGMFADLDNGVTNALGIPKGAFEAQATSSQIKLGRLGKVEEVAGLVAYLASDIARYVTGQTIAVDGGMHLA